MLYFSYGSNMLGSRMVERCPTAKNLGIFLLPNYRLTWDSPSTDGSGKCGIELSHDSTVYGILWYVSVLDMLKLAVFESNYNPVNIILDGLEIYTFIPKKKSLDILPTKEYHSIVVEGAEENQLPAEYINTLKSIKTLREENYNAY